MKKISDEKLAERIELLEHAEAVTGQLSLHGETELACLRELRERRRDAYLNSVRAEGVEMLATKITKSVSDEGKPDSHHAYAYIAMNFADQLRSGTHDTADKAG